MKQKASMGTNRTGVSSSEGRAEAMQQGMDRFEPSSHGTSEGPGKVRIMYSKASLENEDQRGLGSVPSPTSLKGKAKSAVKKVKGDQPTLLMDKMGERLAFERTGTRLYEALISKHEAFQSFPGGPSRNDLLDILNEEHRHFSTLEKAIRQMGGDPTAMTPSADLAGTAAEGVLKVITDPRTTLLQSLEAILIAELTDGEGWESLAALARDADESELAERCAEARRTESQHLSKVRKWLQAGYGTEDARAAE